MLRLSRSAVRRALVTVVALASTAPALAHAQTPVPARADSARRPATDSLSADSLAARLARAEAAIALLRQQMAEEAETAVRTRSRARLELSARLLTNGFWTSQRVNNVDVPQVAAPPVAGGGGAVLGATVRQSRVGAVAIIPDLLGGTFDAGVDVDFFGGVQNGAGDRRLFPEPRLRTARARLVWARTEVLVGSETPLVSDLDPISVAAVGIPDFSAAGNLWNWLPQVRVTRELTDSTASVRVALQGAVLAPFAGAQVAGEPDAVDAAERARRPFVEGRVRGRWGAAAAEHDLPALGELLDGGGEIGVGVHRGWVDVRDGTLRASRALTIDARVALARGVELRGEGYAGGQLLRGLGGGAIGQAFGRAAAGAPPGALGPPLRDAAGWAQLNWQPHPVLIGGAGCGVNAVDGDDRPVRQRNAVCAAHVAWRPVQPLLVGFEWRRLRTRYDVGSFVAHHLNLALGVEL
jgi:hypothetical protein